jgi:hypothetical protein
MAADPSTETWRATLGASTSAQLRETQAALAASQADLTAMQAERDDARRDVRHLAAELNEQRIQLAGVIEFATAYQPGERDWQVADRDTGITCSSCSGPIVRGQAFQPLADAKGYFSHCFCPDRES